MAITQPLNATFFAFQKREKGGALLATTIAYVVAIVVIFVGYIALNLNAIQTAAGAYISTIQQAAQGGPPDATAIATAFAPITGSYFLLTFVLIVLLAAYEAACLRWLIRGERGGFLGLSLGADTWRVWLGYWVWFFLFIGFCILYFVISLVVSGGAFAALAASKNNTGAGGLTAVLVSLLGFIGALALVIFLAVRLAPGAATSIIAKRFAMFDAWGATRGRFWALLGAFALLWLLYLLAILIMEAILGAAIFGSMFTSMMGPGASKDPSTMFAAFGSPTMMITIGLFYLGAIVVAMVFQVALYGVNARAVLAAAEESKIPGVTPPQAQVFS